MMDASKHESGWSLLGPLLCVAFAGLLRVTIGTWIRDALVLQYDESMRAAVGNAGLLGIIVASLLVAGPLTARIVAALSGAGYAALIALVLVVGSLEAWSLLALRALGAAFWLAVWVQLIQRVLLLARHLRHLVTVLAMMLASTVSLIDAGVLTPFLIEHPRLGLVVSGCLALVLSVAAASARLHGQSEQRGVRAVPWLGAAVRLLVVGMVVSMAAYAATDTLLDLEHLPTDPPWLQAAGAVTAELMLAGVLLWLLRHKPETSSLRVIALTLAVSAALAAACSLLQSRSWGALAWFLNAFASSLASLGETLLMVIVAALAPPRFIGPVLGVWFVAVTLALRLSDFVTEWARGSGAVLSAVAVVAPVLLGACALTLMLSHRPSDHPRLAHFD
ncbi:MAG TPA: hypothetical protein VFU02_07425 [Polyangiaceae bacterium]|nr:hypothetical protein [Polyangiaceae bacterium]